MKVESKAQLNSLRMSPQKVRLVADLIRGMHVRDAAAQLQFSRKAAAKPLHTLLKSAIANAVHNHQMDAQTLIISTIFVNEGVVLKRWMPRAQGRATPLRKRSSHITLVLSGEGTGTRVTDDTTAAVSKKTTTDEDAKVVSDVPQPKKRATRATTATKNVVAKKPRARARTATS
jgi:large subunit ribosomal protein L22